MRLIAVKYFLSVLKSDNFICQMIALYEICYYISSVNVKRRIKLTIK